MKMVESDVLSDILDEANKAFIKHAGADVDVSARRLDSARARANMAKLSGIELFKRTIKSFLTRLKKNLRAVFDLIDQSLCVRHPFGGRDEPELLSQFLRRRSPR